MEINNNNYIPQLPDEIVNQVVENLKNDQPGLLAIRLVSKQYKEYADQFVKKPIKLIKQYDETLPELDKIRFINTRIFYNIVPKLGKCFIIAERKVDWAGGITFETKYQFPTTDLRSVKEFQEGYLFLEDNTLHTITKPVKKKEPFREAATLPLARSFISLHEHFVFCFPHKDLFIKAEARDLSQVKGIYLYDIIPYFNEDKSESLKIVELQNNTLFYTDKDIVVVDQELKAYRFESKTNEHLVALTPIKDTPFFKATWEYANQKRIIYYEFTGHNIEERFHPKINLNEKMVESGYFSFTYTNDFCTLTNLKTGVSKEFNFPIPLTSQDTVFFSKGNIAVVYKATDLPQEADRLPDTLYFYNQTKKTFDKLPLQSSQQVLGLVDHLLIVLEKNPPIKIDAEEEDQGFTHIFYNAANGESIGKDNLSFQFDNYIIRDNELLGLRDGETISLTITQPEYKPKKKKKR